MQRLTRLLICGVVFASSLSVLADDPKPATPAKKTDDKKKEEKKLTEAEQAELEYKKYLEAQAKALAEVAKLATHQQVAEVKVQSKDKKTNLQTLTMTDDNRILALVAQQRGYAAATKNGFGEIHVFSIDGKLLQDWKVDFHAQSLANAPDGTIYVAGDGQVARFDKDGKALGKAQELPHITEMFKDKESMRKKAEEALQKQKEQQAANMKAARKQFEERIKKIEETKEDERTKAQVRQLEQFKSNLKIYDDMEKQDRGMTVDQYIASQMGRARTINGIAVSDKDVFVACGETAGWGYAIWRFDRDMSNPKKILGDIGGCCGQMDVQVHGTDIIVAENTKHAFTRYDREGKKLSQHGKRGTDADPAGFGGCCNPMNTRTSGSSGDIYTAESEGVVKRFSPTGEFKGVAATIKIGGGCKNVAIGVSSDGDKIVFCDQPGSRFFVLAKKTDAKTDGNEK